MESNRLMSEKKMGIWCRTEQPIWLNNNYSIYLYALKSIIKKYYCCFTLVSAFITSQLYLLEHQLPLDLMIAAFIHNVLQ